jgi:hypothetical protein
LILLVAAPIMFALNCSTPNEPVEPQGNIVLRMVASSAPSDAAAPAIALASPGFDSVAVSVFRAGGAIVREITKGAALDADSVDVSLSCAAEPNKRVGVDLFQSGTMIYHGANTDVDVVANRRTSVLVDVYPFAISSFTSSPGVTNEGSAFALRWSDVAIATSYLIEASPTADFDTIEWQQTVTDTISAAQLGPGSHYFRVAPRTPYATGSFVGPQFGYVLSGSNKVEITGFGAPGAIPGDEISIFGENLDFPGTQLKIGTKVMEIVSSSWGEIVARMPRDATTATVSATSSLGTAVSKDELIAQRIAYVTMTGQFAKSFIDLMWTYKADVANSGVVAVPIPDLDTRDMSVFDVIVVANDTGTDVSNWGGGSTARALAIVASDANVLAMGDGGISFLLIAVPAFRGNVSVTSQTSCYTSNPSATIFQSPHSLGVSPLGGWIDFCQNNERTLSVNNSNGTSQYASTGILSNKWVLMDDVVGSQRYFYWGFAADPKGFAKAGQDCMANIMNLLVKERGAVPMTALR